ncbi:MAG: FAD-dependent monooxygenase [Cyclobacteriaceae bacterium]|nr:FAD-dependent monooxygenase [Cyclobacteriaceae bacterium]
MAEQPVLIVGAGLCGTLLALRLAQKGYKVRLHEKRADMREQDQVAGRSINLALSDRGLWALEKVGVKEEILKECIPMKGRLVHPLGEKSFLSPYSGRSGDYINSVSRAGLNIALLNKVESHHNIEIHFNSKCRQVDLETSEVVFREGTSGKSSTVKASVVIGADGAGSAVRRSMMAATSELLFNYSQNFLTHGYKELSISPTESGGYRIEKNALHIWPRGDFMIIALPNIDGSFTLTMFNPMRGPEGFEYLQSDSAIKEFFEEYFPHLIEHCPHYLQEYKENPVGILGTIKCYPWQAFGKTLVIGDAAHAIVPFYGQGMNASFEDVRILDEIIDENAGDWSKVFEQFQQARVENTNAIADLAIDNFYEMRDRVDDEDFVKKRQLEMLLENEYPDYYSKYSLVTFRPEVPYSKAMELGRKQDEYLLDVCRSQVDFEDLDIPAIQQGLAKMALEILHVS